MPNAFDQFDSNGGTAVAEPTNAFDQFDQSGNAFDKFDAPPAPTPPEDQSPPIPKGLSKAQLQQMQINQRVADVAPRAIESALNVAEPLVEGVTPAAILNTPQRLIKMVSPNSPNAQDVFHADTPIVQIPRAKGTGVLAGLENVGGGVLSSLTTPESIVTLPLAVQSRLVTAIFGTQMASQLPEEAQIAVKTLKDPNATTAEKVEAVGNPIVNTAMIAALAKVSGKKVNQAVEQIINANPPIPEESQNQQAPPGANGERPAPVIQPVPFEPIPPAAPPADTGVSEPVGEPVQSHEEIAKAIDAVPYGKEFDPGNGIPIRQYNLNDLNQTMQAPANWTLEQVKEKADKVRQAYQADANHVVQPDPEIPGQFNIVNSKGSVVDSFPSEAEANKYLPEYNKPPMPSEVDAILAKKSPPGVHGGAQEDLPPDQQAISKANNSREAFARVQAEADAKKQSPTPAPATKTPVSDVEVIPPESKNLPYYPRNLEVIQQGIGKTSRWSVVDHDKGTIISTFGSKHLAEEHLANLKGQTITDISPAEKQSPTAKAGAVNPKNAPEPVLGEPKAPAQSLNFNEPWTMTKADYLKNRPDKSLGSEVAESTAKIDAKKRGSDYYAVKVKDAVRNTADKIVTPDRWQVKRKLSDEEKSADHREWVEAALKKGKSVPPEVLADYPDLQKQAPAQSPQLYKVGKNPKAEWTVIEDLPMKPAEKAEGYRMVRIKNVNSGATQVVEFNRDLTPASNKPAADKAAQESKAKSLDDQLRAFKLDPSVFSNVEQKRAALKRAKALHEGPGGATAAPEGSEEFGKPGTFSRDVSGIAARVRGQRERAGMTDPTVPGAGIAPEASVERGKQLLAEGANPEQVIQNFEATQRFSSADIAIVRAHADRLARETNHAEEAFGTDSPEYREAYNRESAWADRTKAMQTEWAKAGHAQQGEVDIDTGTFSGIKRAYRDAHDGKEMPKEDEAAAKKLADENKKNAEDRSKLIKEAGDEIDKIPEEGETWVEKANNKALEVQEEAARKAKEAADKTVREAAARAAIAETKARVEAQRLKTAEQNVQVEATRKAQSAVDKVIRESAARRARDAAKKGADVAEQKRKLAQVQVDAAKKAQAIADKTVRDAAIARAKKAVADRIKAANKKQIAGTLPFTETEFFKYKGGRMTNDQVKALWQYVKKNYIDKGSADFTDIVNKTSTDLGLNFKDVADGLGQPKNIRKITDELWRKQTDARRVNEAAKRWIRQQTSPLLGQVIPRLARVMFGAKVFGHGGVAFGTHAPMVAFMPKFWKTYFRDYGKMYNMVMSEARYEQEAQALRADPNYTTAQRAGLVNDPYKVEDFNNPNMAQYFGKLSGAGNRGYFALKILRQDMFNQHWRKISESMKTPEMAQAIADSVNHITGVVKSSVGGNKTALAFFAPRLMASRAAFLFGDPYRAIEATSAALSPKRWKALPPHVKWQILNQVKEKATIGATALGLLLANQALLSAVGSKQKINLTDPTRSDFWKFKAAGMDFSYGNAVLNMARLPIRLWKIGAGDGGKLKHVIYPDESMYSAAGEYLRSQAAPFTSLGLDFIFKGDYQNRPLPQIPGYGKPIPVPKRLRAQGIKPYTWPEFVASQVAPIPFEEPIKEVFRVGFGFSPEQLKAYAKAAGTTMIMAGTGGRISEDLTIPK